LSNFADRATPYVTAAVVAGLVGIGNRYFRGNVLGFFGFCVLLVAGVYLLAYGCSRASRWYRNTVRRDESANR